MQNYLPNLRKRDGHVPFVPKPEHKEMPVVEHLITPAHGHDTRPAVIKPYDNVMRPQLNRLYGSLRVEDGWQWQIDNYAKGGVTSVAAATVAANVTLAQTAQETRLLRWPGAVQMYLAIRSFGLALSTATLATAGSLDVYYQDTIGGQIIPLGSIANNDELNLTNVNILIPTPITDAGALNLPIGQVQVTLSAGATVGTYIYQIAYAYVYLLPTTKPYEVQHVEDLLDAHPGSIHKSS